MILIINRPKLFLVISTIFIFLKPGLTQQNNISQNKDLCTISDIPAPEGFNRISDENNKFDDFLRNLELLPPISPVLDFRGKTFKSKNDTSVAAVVNWDISGRRLEQCMDILVRFYAEFLWQEKKIDKLVLPLPGGYQISWESWKNGYRPYFKGINVDLRKTAVSDSSRNTFEKYLRLVFAESNTQQFYFAYKPVDRYDIRIGDFIVKKGVKGHAVIIIDLAKDKNGNLRALIGQGDTPACQFYLLNYRKNSPWIPLDFNKEFLPLPIRKKMTWDGLRRFNF